MEAVILSNWLDTNGQNARFVQAARKYGTNEAVLRAMAIGRADPGGVVGRYQAASRKHPIGLTIRSAHKHDEYFAFEGDLVWDPRNKASLATIRQLARDADVIHLNNSDVAIRYFQVQAKPMLLHHHGSMFRNNPQRLLDIAKVRKMVQAVSTVDLQRPAPGILHWLPTAYDVSALRNFAAKNGREPDGRVRIVHTPTSRELKRTNLLVTAVRELQAEGVPVDLYPAGLLTEDDDWLPRMTNAEAVAEKAKADIVFDQIMFGYGCNAVEAWAMGKPVISGADEWTTKRMRDLWGQLPYEHATEKTIKAVIRKMVKSADLRAEVAERGVAHVTRYHDELPALEILAELYHEAIKAKVRPRIEGKGVLFRSRKRVLHIDGQPIPFHGGVAEVKDVEVIERLRRTIKTRPLFGVEEVA